MVKLSFEKIDAEKVGKLINDIDGAAELENVVREYKGVVFALNDGEKYKAAASMMFEMNDDVLTVALRKLYLSGLYISGDADMGQDGMMLEYTAEQAKYMGYDLLTVKVALDDVELIKFYSCHGFDRIVKVDERERYMILQRDIRIKIKCCGFYA